MAPAPSPTPSPWRTLGRFILRAALALLLLAIAWGAWYAYAAHVLRSRLALYRSRGEPITGRDLLPPALPFPDAREIAFAAYGALALSRAEADLIEGNGDPHPDPILLPISDPDMALGRALLDRHAAAVDTFRQTRQHPRAAWPIDPDHLYSMSFTGLGQMRRLAMYFRAMAFIHHQDHREDLALQDLADLRRCAAIIDQGQFIIHHLVAIACDALASDAVLEIAPDLEIQSPASPHGIPREDLAALIRDLLDCSQPQNALIHSLRGERVFAAVADDLIDWHFFPLRPMYRFDICRTMSAYDALIADLGPGLPSYQMAVRSVPPDVSPTSNLDEAVRSLSRNYSVRRMIELHYRGLVQRQAAAVRLAIRLYELDHHGQIPPDLPALVPACLPALPPDLFRRDAGPFHYVPERRLFYSVSSNQIDDGATITFPSYRVMNWQAPDAVVPLDRIPRPGK